MDEIFHARAYIQKRIAINSNGCWLWTLGVNNWGYGRSHRILGERSVHRMSFRAFKGRIPKSKRVLHQCDVPRCCNPEHLFLGTPAENVSDMHSKGRGNVPRGEACRMSKLTVEAVKEIRSSKERIASLARKFGVSWKAVNLARRGVTWQL